MLRASSLFVVFLVPLQSSGSQTQPLAINKPRSRRGESLSVALGALTSGQIYGPVVVAMTAMLMMEPAVHNVV
jgi:hypothetical protein